MSIFTRMLQALKPMLCSALYAASSLFPMRHDWPECCRDSDEMRRVIQSMRDECWRTGA